MLVDILERIELPPASTIPDADTVKKENLSRWTIPHTEITMVKIEDGQRQGEWLFSADTVQRMHTFYDQVKDLPYRPDAILGTDEVTGLGIYETYRFWPEESFPQEWLLHLPAWAKSITFENPVWKWLAFGLILSIGYGLFTLIRLASRKLESLSDANKVSIKWWRLLPPISGALLALSAKYLIDKQINAVGMADAVSETALWVMSLFFGPGQSLNWAALFQEHLSAPGYRILKA
jgi:MscS family membrane protein